MTDRPTLRERGEYLAGLALIAFATLGVVASAAAIVFLILTLTSGGWR